MNDQEAFDKMVTHLFTQGEPAKNEKTTECYYRMCGGKMCAVGALIPNSEYKSEFEGESIYNVIDEVPSLSGLSLMLLEEAQAIHDGLDPEGWYERFSSLANQFTLSTKVLDTYENTL